MNNLPHVFTAGKVDRLDMKCLYEVLHIFFRCSELVFRVISCEFFGKIFRRIFWRNFLGGIFWEEFFGKIFFGRNSLFTLLKSAKLLQIDLFVKILVFVEKQRNNLRSLEVQLQLQRT